MANKTIDDFTQISSLSSTDAALVAANGTTFKATMEQLQQFVFQGNPVKVRCGTTEATTGGTHGDVTVYFDDAGHSNVFSQPPVVIAEMWSQTTAWRSMNVCINGTFVHAATFQFYNASGTTATSQSVKFSWIAVGY